MTITVTASLPDTGSWFAPKKDGSGIVRFELSATEFPEIIKAAKFMDCYTQGGATFTLIIDDGKKA